jgi:cytochrome c oxidase subunit 2
MKSVLTPRIVKAIMLIAVVGISLSSQGILERFSLANGYQEAALFGVGSDSFEPYTEKTSEEAMTSRVKWMIYIASALLLLVITFVFDIASYAYKITGKRVANANKVNAWLMLIFLIAGLGFAAWEFMIHGKYTKVYNSSSLHGKDYDSMFMITLILTGIVFVITQVLLFVYAFRYQQKEGRKATYYSHNNTLEVFWTIIPAIVLTFLVLRGYAVWKDIMYVNDNRKDAQEIEVFAYQFGWTARYPGPDNAFGAHNFNFISGTNELGLAVKSEIDELRKGLQEDIDIYVSSLENIDAYLLELKNRLEEQRKLGNFKKVDDIRKEISNVTSGDYAAELKLMHRRRVKQLERMNAMENDAKLKETLFDGSVHDDMITKEIYVVKDKPVRLKFRARDVIHSAYLPDFRVQMNCVPGMDTEFNFVPTKSTEAIRKEKGDDKFDYYLFCNKICGTAHYNMKIKFVVVDDESALNEWKMTQSVAFPRPLPTREVTAEGETSNDENGEAIDDQAANNQTI